MSDPTDADQVKPGMKRLHYDVPIVLPPPKPLVEQVFMYAGYEGRKFDEFALRLSQHAAILESEIGTSLDAKAALVDAEVDVALEALLRRQHANLDAIQTVITTVRLAADQLRFVRIVLAPYVDEKSI